MSQVQNTIQIYTGKLGRQYYTVNDSPLYFDINFPINIACHAFNEQLIDTFNQLGPYNCKNCNRYGTFKNIHFNVCANCHGLPAYKPLVCHHSGGCFKDDIQEQLDLYKTCNGYMILDCDSDKDCIINHYYHDVDFTRVGLNEKHQQFCQENHIYNEKIYSEKKEEEENIDEDDDDYEINDEDSLYCSDPDINNYALEHLEPYCHNTEYTLKQIYEDYDVLDIDELSSKEENHNRNELEELIKKLSFHIDEKFNEFLLKKKEKNKINTNDDMERYIGWEKY